jgi:hypothetical protein
MKSRAEQCGLPNCRLSDVREKNEDIHSATTITSVKIFSLGAFGKSGIQVSLFRASRLPCSDLLSVSKTCLSVFRAAMDISVHTKCQSASANSCRACQHSDRCEYRKQIELSTSGLCRSPPRLWRILLAFSIAS